MNIEKTISNLGLRELSSMQRQTADAILRGKGDVVVLSPTGSGKTLAYLLPLAKMLSETLDDDYQGVRALVIVPGRELALQSAEVLQAMKSPLCGMALYGGRPTMDEHRELRRRQPHIVFATPGRIADHLGKGNIDAETIEWLVIDEFDKCLEMGFQDEMMSLLGLLPRVRRRILLSATEQEAIPGFVNMGRTTQIDHRQNDEKDRARVIIYKVYSPERDKLPTLRQLLLHLGSEKTVVFLNYRDSVERTAAYLREAGFTLSMYHGGLEQAEREDALYCFANSSTNILVATDLASRGLDIPDIDNIVHYHLPETHQNYIHRIGRTARWDRQGRAFFLLAVAPADDNGDGQQPAARPHYLDSGVAKCSEYIDFDELPLYELPPTDGLRPSHPRMATLYIGKGKRDKLSKGDIVGFLCKKGGLTGSDIGQISVEERFTYVAVARQKLREVLRRVQGEKIKGLKTLFVEKHPLTSNRLTP